MTKRDRYFLLGILVVGAILRIWHYFEFSQGPDFAAPGVDAEFHDYWARGLAVGDWTPPEGHENPNIQGMPFLRPPGYPYFLAAVYKVFGTSYTAPRGVQYAMGLGNAILAFVIGRRWFGRLIGVSVAALMAVYWAFIYFEAEFHAPALMIFLTLWMTYALGRWAETPSWKWAALAGGLFGLSALVLPNVLMFAPFVAFWMIRHAMKVASPLEFKRGALQFGLFCFAAALTISPGTIRNYRVSGEFIPITTNAGINLYIGNHEGAEGYCLVEIPDLGKFETCFDYPALVRNLEAKEGRKFTHKEVDAYFQIRAMDHIVGHPLEFLKLTLTKTLMFWGPTEVSHNKEDELERRHYAALHGIPIQFGLIMAMSLAGATAVAVEILGNRRRRKNESPQRKQHAGRAALADAHLWDWRPISTAMAVLMFFYVSAFFLSILPFFNAGRYRIPIIPFLLFFCAIGIARCTHYFRQRRPARCAGVIGTMVAVFIVMSAWPFKYEPDLSNWHYARGVCFARTDRIEKAIAEYESAIRANEANAKAHFNLGVLLQKVGRPLEAAKHLDAVAATGAYELEAKRAKAQALVSGGHLDAAAIELESILAQHPDDRASLLMLAAIRADQGRIDDAAGLYKAAIALKPGDAATHYNFGATMAAAGRIEPAIEQFQAAIDAKPDFFEAHNNLATSLVQLNRLDEAVEAFRAALRAESGSREAHLNLALVLARQSKHGEVIELLKSWLIANPGDADAHLRMGDALVASKRASEAIPHYEAVLRAYPNNEAAKRRLAEITPP